MINYAILFIILNSDSKKPTGIALDEELHDQLNGKVPEYDDMIKLMKGLQAKINGELFM